MTNENSIDMKKHNKEHINLDITVSAIIKG